MVFSKDLHWHFSLNTKWWLRMNRSVDNCLLRRQPLVWQIRVGCWIVQYSWARQLRNSTYHFTGQLIHFLSCLARQGVTCQASQSHSPSKPGKNVCPSGQYPQIPRNVPPASLAAYYSIMQEYNISLRLYILWVYLTSRNQETAVYREYHNVLQSENELPDQKPQCCFFNRMLKNQKNVLMSVGDKEARD